MQTCSLCLQPRTLRKSHLIADSVYALLRGGLAPGDRSQHHVLVTEDTTLLTNQELKCRLLCDACEGRVSDEGERVVIGECLRRSGDFKLLKKLRANASRAFGPRGDLWLAAHACGNVNVDAYRYYALSFFWRGSVGSWPSAEGRQWRGKLGKKYEGIFRAYLAGESTFPAQARIVAFVDSDPAPLPAATGPSVSREYGYYVHKFYIPGVEFRMFLGQTVSTHLELFDRVGDNLIFVACDFRTQPSFPEIVSMVKKSTPRGKLADEGMIGGNQKK